MLQLALSFMLGVCLCLLPSLSVRADDKAATDYSKLPEGYQSEQVGAVRWTYPQAAHSETKTLQAHELKAFALVTSQLGVKVAPELDIRVARNPEQMQALAPDGVPLPGYADGIAFPERGLVLLTLTEPETWFRPDMENVLTHELSHVALYRALNGNPVPRWFSEGVAVHQASDSSIGRIRTLWDATLRGKLIPLDQLANTFPAHHSDVDLAYAQSADFVGFMTAGRDERLRFHRLLTEVAAGKPFADAFKSAYQVPVGYMEREWHATLSQRFGRWPALLMGLTFIWVLGALLLVIGYVRARHKHHETLQRWEIEEAPLLSEAVPPPPPPTPVAQSSVDDFFDKRTTKNDTGIPTVVHDGQSHTLH